MKLIIAEKPSVAQTIAKVLRVTDKKDGYLENDKYIVSWCVGHLVGLCDPESYGEEYKKWDKLPIVPSCWNYEVKASTKKQFDTLKRLMNDSRVDSLICATDAGREGELIFRHVYNKACCKKPFERLWISSLEDSAVRKGFENLKDGSDYDNLYKSALCRERADWLVGINATRLFTTIYNADRVLSIGRVQTPTLAMIVNRDNDISSFKKEKYYKVGIDCSDFSAESERIDKKDDAQNIKADCDGAAASVTDIVKEEKKVSPPKLYDLTSLQRDANRLYGFTAQQTLEAVQRLYDNKLSTYPRTDSRYLTEDMEETARSIINIISEKADFAKDLNLNPNIKIVMNNKKVTDHHAIIPTANIKALDFATLTDTDRKILYLISSRLLSATADKYIYESTKITIKCANTDFFANGKTVLQKGFKEIEEKFGSFMKCKSENEKEEDEKELPEISEGQEFENVSADISEHYTQPPKLYTEDTLLSAMERAGNDDYDTDEVERKGLGTPATRAGIIETLIKRDYVQRNKKQLISTQKGKSIIAAVPDKIKSAKMTAEWENRLVLVSKGQTSDNDFMNDISAFIRDIIESTKAADEMKAAFNEREVIGKCPRCSSNIYEGKLNFYCENKACEFALWKKNKFWESKKKEITKAAAKKLLADGKVHFKDLYSPAKDKTYEADILLDDTGGKYVNFKLDFPKK